MSNYPEVSFMYYNEQEMVKAGVLDMHHCIEVMEEVFGLMGKGDYRMGGRNHNSHGILLNFPDDSPFPNMPKNGPDRRFMAMVAYLGGRFNIVGEKWYGSNHANLSKGLPRSILMCILNNADTGAIEALASGNLVSNVRTGAIPGVGAKYLARKDAKVLGLIACGAISRGCFTAIVDQAPNLETVKLYDVAEAPIQKLSAFIKENYPQLKIEVAKTMQEVCEGSDIINSASSGKVMPFIDEKWLKKGVYVSLPASIDFDHEFITSDRCKLVVDNWKMYEAWSNELEHPVHPAGGLLGDLLIDMIEDGEYDPKKKPILNIGDIIAGNVQGRTSDDDIILFGMGGQPVYDVAWTKEITDKAKEMGLGTELKVWDKPYLA
jgi:ornithine cyclodeaminase/alanine dehydrogenase-like protein (mu-crystallin family)